MLENLVEKLTDYGTKHDKTEDAIDEMYGVAVVFDEDEDKDAQLDEVQVNYSRALWNISFTKPSTFSSDCHLMYFRISTKSFPSG